MATNLNSLDLGQTAALLQVPRDLRAAPIPTDKDPGVCEVSHLNRYASKAGDLGSAPASRGHMANAVAVTQAQSAAAAAVTGARPPAPAASAVDQVGGVGAITAQVTNAFATVANVPSLFGPGSVAGFVASGAAIEEGVSQVGQGLRNGDTSQAVSGSLLTGAGAAGGAASTAGVLSFAASSAKLTSLAGAAGLELPAAAATATIAGAAGGVAAMFSGARDIHDAKDDFHRDIGIAKVAGGATVEVGLLAGSGLAAGALEAVGLGTAAVAAASAAPLILAAGTLLVAGAYVANTDWGHAAINSTEHAASKAWNWATSWL